MPEIPHPITEEVIQEVIDACRSELQDEHISISHQEGCGDYGCVFATSDGRALKITKHKKEADAAHWILMRNGSHPNYPLIYGVWVWEECHPYDDPVYVILRENLDNLKDINLEWFGSILDDFEYRLHEKAATQVLTEDEIYSTLADIFEEIPGTEDDETRLENLAELFVWNASNGIWLDDIIISNWGQREDGTIVIRDLGAVKIL